MATDRQIMDVRIALQNIEDFAGACHAKLAEYKDADRDWLLSRVPNLEVDLKKLDAACKAAAEDPSTDED
jgi:hypothetical protein